MSFARKLQRHQQQLHKTSCCGAQMVYKPSYNVYICPKCGKVVKIDKKQEDL